MSETTKKRSNTRLVLILTSAVFVMFGFGYALVPLYDLFCEVTGIGGRPTIAAEQPNTTRPMIEQSRKLSVEFTATANNSMPWTIEPLVKKTKVHPGEVHIVNYRVTNTTNRPMLGQAIPSITPMQAGKHVVKLECFCFERQELAAGEARDMPVRFYIDPALSEEINTVTFSYSFFQLEHEPETTGKS